MKVKKTDLPGVLILHPQVFHDERGWFMESYNASKLAACGIHDTFVQENHLRSAHKGVLRGVHFQNEPFAQAKLLRCTVGRIADFAIDLRKGSPTYLRWMRVDLSAEGFEQLYLPAGFGHAAVSLTDESELQYMVNVHYTPTHDRSIFCCDPALGIDWPFPESELILSEKDAAAPLLRESDCNLIYHRKD